MKNKYKEFDGYIVIEYTNKKGELFEIKIDKGDFEKVNIEGAWYVHHEDIISGGNKKTTRMLNLLLGEYNGKKIWCKRLNNNPYDLRKSNLELLPKPVNKGESKGNKFIEHENHTIMIVESAKYGKFEVLIDKEDLNKIKDYTWSIVMSRKNCPYICTHTNNTTVTLHHLLFDYNHQTEKCDHITRDTLDNRKSNLRICDNFESIWNQGTRKDNTSGVRGVIYNNEKNKWTATLSVKNKRICLGDFNSFEDAVKARKDAELKYRGDFYVHPSE